MIHPGQITDCQADGQPSEQTADTGGLRDYLHWEDRNRSVLGKGPRFGEDEREETGGLDAGCLSNTYNLSSIVWHLQIVQKVLMYAKPTISDIISTSHFQKSAICLDHFGMWKLEPCK